MKKLVAVAGKAQSLDTPLGLLTVAALAVTFWLTTGPSSVAQGQCQVCHKGATLTFECGSLPYRGHLGHGDPNRACNVTPVENP